MHSASHNARGSERTWLYRLAALSCFLRTLLSMLHSAPVGGDVLEVKLLQVWDLLHLQSPQQMLETGSCSWQQQLWALRSALKLYLSYKSI